MPRIDWIDDQDATGEVAEVYRKWKEAHPERREMPGILKALSLRPDLLRHVIDLVYPLHFSDGFLTRRQKERIATYVSALNRCPY